MVPCESADGNFNSADGCYYRVADPLPPSGPVRVEFDRYGGQILWASCWLNGGSGGYVWRPDAPALPQVTDEMVRAQAVRYIPTAAVGLAPHGSTLVNIETVMWAAAPEDQNLPAVTILGRRVQISLSFDHVNWTFGDGSSDGSGPAGKPYDAQGDPCRTRECADYFGHVYRTTGSKTVTATASWHISYTVDGGAVQDIAAPVDGPSSTADIVVKQARGVLVPNPGDN